MATLIELTAQIVTAHVSGANLTSDDLVNNLKTVYNTLKGLETGETVSIAEEPVVEAQKAQEKINLKQIFKKDEVICMVCSKGGFKTLKRHLTVAHNLKPAEYRKQFGIPAKQSLSAKNYVESRRKSAIENNLGAGLEKARATRKANAKAKKASAAKVNAKPAVKTKAHVPVVKVKIADSAKTQKAKILAKVKKPVAGNK